MMQKLEFKNANADIKAFETVIQIKSFDETDGTFEGYASIFGNKDRGDDIVVKGAFTKSLSEHKKSKTLPAMLWQHDRRKPIGVWLEMKEDAKGLYVKGKLALDTQLGKEAYELMKMGALKGLSIGYATIKESYDAVKKARMLEVVDLWEISLVTFGMNTEAGVSGVKSIERISGLASRKEAEKFLRDAEGPFSKKAATAMVGAIYKCFENERDAKETKQAIIANQKKLQELF